MLDAARTVLYVGKARNLRNRVKSYFRQSGLSTRIASMMAQVVDIEVTATHTENEALLLENNLIKQLLPRYNILLRDDKSYPYIYLSDEKFPRLGFHRGAKKAKGQYFGPFPSSSAVRETLALLQKIFFVRQCDNSFFKNRSRPCLQYQIKRCSAPCTDCISEDDYHQDVEHTKQFLQGHSRQVVDDIVKHMEQASTAKQYETAARYRDQIAALNRIQEQQYVNRDEGEADVLAISHQQGHACVAVTFIRDGRNLGTKYFFPRAINDSESGEILTAFLSQYYIGKRIPQQILLSETINDHELLQQAFCQQQATKISISSSFRGPKKRWMAMTQANADDALRRHLLSKASLRKQLEMLQQALGLDAQPDRIECFDISHTFGEAPVASCVVFGSQGPIKSDYRRFNIKDDYRW